MKNKNIEIGNIDVTEVTHYTVWDPISISWTIHLENNFPHYTHILTSLDQNIFGLKSSMLNLNNFSGMIEVAGHISSLFRTIPVIEVNYIKIPKYNLVINNNSYLFTEDLLRFDFWQQIGFNAKKIGKTINVYFNETKLASYEPFVCNKVIKSQNCEQIILDLEHSRTENFVSYDGNDYYRYGTGKRITFNDNIFGYIITATSDERLLDLSAATKIINKAFVIKNKASIMNAQCQSGDERFLNVINYTYKQIDAKTVQINLSWATNIHYKSSCEVRFDLWNKWEITEAKLSHRED